MPMNFAIRRIIIIIIIGGLAAASFYFNIYHGSSYDDQSRSSPNTNTADANNARSAYGYRHPRPPFQRIHHTSHNCTVPSSSGKYVRQVHIPTAVPHLILIGAQKSGTSTLQTIFKSQQHVVKPSRKRTFEPHFFDWEMGLTKYKGNRQFNESSPGVLCGYSEAYSEYFEMSKIQAGVSVAFEKTPSYLNYPSIPSAIEAVCPWKPKILAILRNPVDRAWSQYNMGSGGHKHAKSFVTLVNNEMSQLKSNGILEKALTMEQFEHSGGENPFRFPDNMTLYDYAERIREFSGSRSKALLYRGLYAPLLHPWVEKFAPEDRLMIIQFEEFVKVENEKNRTIVDELLGFAGLENNSTGSHNVRQRRNGSFQRKLVWTNERKYNSMPPRVRQYLTLFYQPFNDHLADLLGEDWRDVWD
mmetsp:Transcript_12429/g.27024  ORF Transcript_12429/g.27024 Transcript_12429/m.27024 type:complete len:414 (-) Transcript_12429:63-1304(-)